MINLPTKSATGFPANHTATCESATKSMRAYLAPLVSNSTKSLIVPGLCPAPPPPPPPPPVPGQVPAMRINTVEVSRRSFQLVFSSSSPLVASESLNTFTASVTYTYVCTHLILIVQKY